jgi:hypothetical protein
MITLTKPRSVPASQAEGYIVHLPIVTADQWITPGATIEFSVHTVTPALTPGMVYLHGEFLDSIGGFDCILTAGGRALAVAE